MGEVALASKVLWLNRYNSLQSRDTVQMLELNKGEKQPKYGQCAPLWMQILPQFATRCGRKMQFDGCLLMTIIVFRNKFRNNKGKVDVEHDTQSVSTRKRRNYVI